MADDPAVEPVLGLRLPPARDFTGVKKLGSRRDALEPWMKQMGRALKLVPSMKVVIEFAESGRPADGGPPREQDDHALNLMLTCMETMQCDIYETRYTTAVALWRGLTAVVLKQSHLNKLESFASMYNLKQAQREPIMEYIERATLYRQRLKDVGVEKDDDDLLMHIIPGLLPSYQWQG
jgi:hypothetical protein